MKSTAVAENAPKPPIPIWAVIVLIVVVVGAVLFQPEEGYSGRPLIVAIIVGLLAFIKYAFFSKER